MSSPLVTVVADAFVLDALVAMTRRGIHHLGVMADGVLRGVVSSSDVLRLELPHPVALSRAIAGAPTVPALQSLAGDVTGIVRRLVTSGASAYDIGALVAELNDQLVRRVLDLTAVSLSAAGDHPPVPYSWLVFGSEARREQTLRTDQDNGLVSAAQCLARRLRALARPSLAVGGARRLHPFRPACDRGHPQPRGGAEGV